MKYLRPSFSVGGASRPYADNYDRIFSKKPETAKDTKKATLDTKASK